jgi:hypothetical protein
MKLITNNTKEVQEELFKQGYSWVSGLENQVQYLCAGSYLCYDSDINADDSITYSKDLPFQVSGGRVFVEPSTVLGVDKFLNSLPKQVTEVKYNGVVYEYVEVKTCVWKRKQ